MLRDRWRVLQYEERDAAMNMALDESIAEAIRFRIAGPTIRIYGWRPSAISVGCFQSVEDEVNVEECKRLGVDIVRRSTGGGAVYHDSEGDITYSIICPEGIMPKDINEAYKEVCGLLVNAFKLIGIEARFEPINDVTIKGKKVSGSAQSRRQGIFLQHGTVIYDIHPEMMFSLLRIGTEKLEGRGLSSPGERVTSIRENKKVPKEYVIAALTNAFVMNRQWYSGDLTSDEEARAEMLARTKYGDDSWTYSR